MFTSERWCCILSLQSGLTSVLERKPLLVKGVINRMSFGTIIKKLRRERDMTQERLAEILSISPQAISRWETDMAMPDISLIAPLCNLFNITSDELLGIDITRRQQQIKAICSEADKYSQRGYLEKARKILEKGLNKYPDSCDIIYDLMYLASGQYDCTRDDKYLDEAIKWGEKILAQSTEDQQRHGAIQILCFSYKDAGRTEEAVKMAKSMPFLAVSREMLLSRIYSGSNAYNAKQREASNLLQFLSNNLFFLQTKLDSGENAYTEEEFAMLRDKRVALLHLFFEDGNFGFYHTHLSDTHREQAFYYAKKGEDDKALTHLRLAAEHAIKFVTFDGRENTSLVFRGMFPGSWSTDSSENDAAVLLKRMENRVFDKIRQTPEFISIKEELSKYAGPWLVN